MPAKQLKLGLKPRYHHGGARPGAGRPRTSSLQAHVRRARFTHREPVHVTLRLQKGLPNLRRKDAFKCLRRAVVTARRHGFAIIHFNILSNHLHLLLEVRSPEALALQMQSFGISLAKRLNRITKRKGAVFTERYHAHILKNPRETKNAIRYVLANEFNHRHGLGRIELDAFSSAIAVPEKLWAKLLGSSWRSVVGFSEETDPNENEALLRTVGELMAAPGTWLMNHGWLRAKTQ